MSISCPEDEPNGYTPFNEPVYFFTDKAIVPPPAEQPPVPPDAEPEQKS